MPIKPITGIPVTVPISQKEDIGTSIWKRWWKQEFILVMVLGNEILEWHLISWQSVMVFILQILLELFSFYKKLVTCRYKRGQLQWVMEQNLDVDDSILLR